MLEILIVIIYSAIFCIFIAKTSLFTVKDLSVSFICIAFLVKISAGILYGYLHGPLRLETYIDIIMQLCMSVYVHMSVNLYVHVWGLPKLLRNIRKTKRIQFIVSV
jgi:hypothetical protein